MKGLIPTVEELRKRGICLYILPTPQGWYCGEIKEDELNGCRLGIESSNGLETAVNKMITRYYLNQTEDAPFV